MALGRLQDCKILPRDVGTICTHVFVFSKSGTHLDLHGYMDMWIYYGYMDIWIYGHRIKNGIFGLVDIKFKMGYLDPSIFWGPIWTRPHLDPAQFGPGPSWTRGPRDTGTRDLGLGTRGPGIRDPGTQELHADIYIEQVACLQVVR